MDYMNNKFTVINSADEDKSKETARTDRIAKLNKLWERQYRNSVLQAAQKNKDIKLIADYPQADIKKIAFSGIKYICSWRDARRENYTRKFFTGKRCIPLVCQGSSLVKGTRWGNSERVEKVFSNVSNR